MPDTAADASTLSPLVTAWLAPLEGDSPSGANLEYEPEFLELLQVAGKPATQFGAAEPANWPRIVELAESLLKRTRDLRLAMWWGRAKVNLEGFAAVPSAVTLLHGLLDGFWDTVHPLPDPDDPDSLARLSVIGGLDKIDSLLGDVRAAPLSSDRQLAGLRGRDIEVALGKLAPRPDEATRTVGQITGALAGVPEVAAALRAQSSVSSAALAQIHALMNERFRSDLVVDLAAFTGILRGLQSMLPAMVEMAVAEEAPGVDAPLAAGAAMPAPVRSASGVHSVDTRQDAMRAIELVCAYLERNEPTNPAQLLLQRASRVINKNFLQLVQELAPDAMKDVARIMGIDPSTVSDPN